MNYTTLVDDIVTRLAPLIADGIEVERLPETELEYTEAFEAPRVTVAYKRSQFGNENVRIMSQMASTNEFVGDEYAEIHIAYRSRLLYDDLTGVYAVCLEAKKLLYGFMPSDWGRLFPKEFDLEKNEAGVWLAVMIFTCVGRAVQHLADDAGEDYPELVETTFNFEIT